MAGMCLRSSAAVRSSSTASDGASKLHSRLTANTLPLQRHTAISRREVLLLGHLGWDPLPDVLSDVLKWSTFSTGEKFPRNDQRNARYQSPRKRPVPFARSPEACV